MKRPRPTRLKTLWTAGRLAGRRLLHSEFGARDQELGQLLSEELDAMKGLAMKLGQIVSYMGVPLPDELEATMAKLQTGVTGMTEAETRQQLEQGLGQPIDQLFEVFDPTPVAAASIGQVHRARFEGRDVAVKIRYPHIQGEFNQDLRLVERIAGMAGLASSVDGKAIVRELAARLEEECDYAREARLQGAFRTAFADDPQVLIPEPIPSRSSDTVLTSEWMTGQGFATLAAEADTNTKIEVALTLTRFAYRSLLQFGCIQADPHPGNYLFRPGSGVIFLDYGCVRRLSRHMVQSLRRQLTAVREGDRTDFAACCHEMGLVGNAKNFDADHFFMVMKLLYQPFCQPEFRFDDDYMRDAMQHNGPSNPNARSMAIPSEYVWVMRLQWGLWAVLSKLGVTCDYRSIIDQLLSEPPTYSRLASD